MTWMRLSLLSDRIYIMTQRPGRIARELTVQLPRPRTESMLVDSAFVACRDEILHTLEAQHA